MNFVYTSRWFTTSNVLVKSKKAEMSHFNFFGELVDLIHGHEDADKT